MMDIPVYLDAASTTRVDPRVLEDMIPYFTEYYGNASSNHSFGAISKKAIEKARIQTADLINADPNEIIFTSGATESINLALKGFVEANSHRGNHIITLKTEHKAVLSTCEYLETKGFEVSYLDVDENGMIFLDQLRDAVNKNTLLVVVLYVNNETGVIQPIKSIGKIAKSMGVKFFSDATQAVGKVVVDVEEDQIDMLCFSGHKLNGPKGIGVLYKRKNIELTPLIHGGGQENGLRGGTYNTPLIVGFGKACELNRKEFTQNVSRLNNQRMELETYYESNNIGKVNFKDVMTAPHIISVTLNSQEADEFLMLKSKEFVASTGSACSAELLEASHVLKEMNIKHIERIIRVSI